MSEDLWLGELGAGPYSLVSVVGRFAFGGWDVAAVLVRAAVVEPVDVLGGGQLDRVGSAPGPVALDQLGLVQPVDGLGQGNLCLGVAPSASRSGRLGSLT